MTDPMWVAQKSETEHCELHPRGWVMFVARKIDGYWLWSVRTVEPITVLARGKSRSRRRAVREARRQCTSWSPEIEKRAPEWSQAGRKS